MGTSTKHNQLDLDMLAADMSDMLDKYEHPLPDTIGSDEIRQALPVFLAAMGLDIEGRPFKSDDEAEQIPPVPPARTEHTCSSKAAGGHYTAGCPRCDELAAGAPPRSAPEWVHRLYAARTAGQLGYAAEIKGHFGKDGRHTAECADVCSFTWWQ